MTDARLCTADQTSREASVIGLVGMSLVPARSALSGLNGTPSLELGATLYQTVTGRGWSRHRLLPPSPLWPLSRCGSRARHFFNNSSGSRVTTTYKLARQCSAPSGTRADAAIWDMRDRMNSPEARGNPATKGHTGVCHRASDSSQGCTMMDHTNASSWRSRSFLSLLASIVIVLVGSLLASLAEPRAGSGAAPVACHASSATAIEAMR